VSFSLENMFFLDSAFIMTVSKVSCFPWVEVEGHTSAGRVMWRLFSAVASGHSTLGLAVFETLHYRACKKADWL